MITVQPILSTSYTDRGNEYKKSNIGKYSAATTMGTGAAIIAFNGIKKIPFEKVKEIPFEKIKNIKNVNIKMPSAKAILQNALAGIEKMAVKAQIKLATAHVKPEKFTKIFKKPVGFKAIKEGIKQFAVKSKNGITTLGSKVLQFVHENPIKLAKASKYAGFVAGAVVTGLAIDYAFNKLSAYRADKK